VNKLFQDKILKFPEAQHPVVLQLGGNNPEKLFKAAQLASSYKYDEINLK
jgi:tRNA-dihydrouridine synthase A